MTHREKVIVSAYTGILMCDFSDVHEYIEKILGGPVWTHQLADKKIWDDIKEASKSDFIAICEAEDLIKRETPMKITEIHVDEYYCPACGAENNCDQGYVQDAYCPACGQRLLPESPKDGEQ